MDWRLFSFVSRSQQRVKIIKILQKPVTPTQIAKETQLNKSHVSRALKEFVERGIAKCLTPKENMGRYYVLTDEGKRILKDL